MVCRAPSSTTGASTVPCPRASTSAPSRELSEEPSLTRPHHLLASIPTLRQGSPPSSSGPSRSTSAQSASRSSRSSAQPGTSMIPCEARAPARIARPRRARRSPACAPKDRRASRNVRRTRRIRPVSRCGRAARRAAMQRSLDDDPGRHADSAAATRHRTAGKIDAEIRVAASPGSHRELDLGPNTKPPRATVQLHSTTSNQATMLS